ncbi:MAG: helix-turn-helix protein [Bacteroidetes bacterium]|nr:helix-turn-helix protein [Bacteroidota bacterium]
MKNIPIRKIKTRTDENFSVSFSIRDIREVQAGKDMEQDLHRHEFFFILAIEKGSGTHVIDFIPHPITDHCIFFMRPGQVHQLKLVAGCTGYVMEFKSDFYHPKDKYSNQLLTKVTNKSRDQFDENKLKRVFTVLGYILNEYRDKQEGYQDIIKANLEIFFLELIRHRENAKGEAKKTNAYEQEQLEKLMSSIGKHISTKKRASQYSELLNLSLYQLNAITKTTLGQTCSDVINDYIILEAKRYLLATTNQVNQIAYHLGYEDVSYFIRFFKKHTGHSPDVFRQSLNEDHLI